MSDITTEKEWDPGSNEEILRKLTDIGARMSEQADLMERLRESLLPVFLSGKSPKDREELPRVDWVVIPTSSVTGVRNSGHSKHLEVRLTYPDGTAERISAVFLPDLLAPGRQSMEDPVIKTLWSLSRNLRKLRNKK